MKKVYAGQVRENDFIEDVFLVKSKNLSVGKTGKPYLVVSLMDRTGDLEGRVWDDAENVSQGFDTDNFVNVGGRVSSYMGKLQLKISNISRAGEEGIDLGDFLPVSKISPDEMMSDLKKIAGKVKDRNIANLLDAFFRDDKLCDAFKRAPAAKGMHHVYIGGLLEHALSLCRLVDTVSAHYGSSINRDILIAGAIFHDIGKTRELSYLRSFGYTDEGRLIGHITIGAQILDDKIREAGGFPQELGILLKHMILSHHGEYEYGSPKRPKTLEATILSYLDDLDAKVNSIQTLIESEAGNDSNWTGYHRLFERYICKLNGMEGSSISSEGMIQPDDKDAALQKVESSASAGKTLTLFGS